MTNLLVKGDQGSFMNKLALALPDANSGKPGKAEKPAAPGAGKPTRGKGQSHIHQARRNKPAVEPPKIGPMAEMLKKLLGKGE